VLLAVNGEAGWKVTARAWNKTSDVDPLPGALVSNAASR